MKDCMVTGRVRRATRVSKPYPGIKVLDLSLGSE